MLPRIFRLSPALLLGLAAAALPVRSQIAVDPPPYTISPDSAAANQEFSLTLFGNYPCNASFSNESVTVDGAKIHLGYEENTLMMEGQAIPCPVYLEKGTAAAPGTGFRVNAPLFRIPALKAGKYEVWAYQSYACMRTEPRCMMAPMEQFAGVLTIGDAGGTLTYHIDPASTPAKKDFDLSLLSYQFNCGTTFDHLSSSVNGNEIVLSFMDHDNSSKVLCPAIYKAYGPSYKMAGLAAGTYQVMAARLPACIDQGCKIKQTLEPAGTLTVLADTGRVNKWFIKPKLVRAGAAFQLHILNDYYGNCNTSFPTSGLTVENHDITASFSIQDEPARECFADIHPAGPVFDVPALKTGLYPVYAVIMPTCPKGMLCPMYMPMRQLVDTLMAATALGIDPFLTSTAGFRAALQGARVELTLPQGQAGTWTLEMMTLSGRMIASARVTAAGGSRAALALKAKPESGLYLVRIQSPDHVIRALPVSAGE